MITSDTRARRARSTPSPAFIISVLITGTATVAVIFHLLGMISRDVDSPGEPSLAVGSAAAVGSNAASLGEVLPPDWGETIGFAANAPIAGVTRQNVTPDAISRISIPVIGVDARVVTRGVDENGVMETAEDPFTVAWYTFSSHPHDVGNAVFSGHVDDVDVGPAVFWDLRDVEPGDVVLVNLADGQEFEYRVESTMSVAATVTGAMLDKIIGRTDDASLTLITCEGIFDPAIQTYPDRLIVRAVQVESSPT